MNPSAIADPACPLAEWTPESYERSCARLPETVTREGRAAILDVMADQAGGIAALLRGNGIPDSDSDPLAWHETATLLRRLAAAERGLVLTVPAWDDEDDIRPWDDLANATTATEHAAACAAVLATFTSDDSNNGDQVLVRPGAVRRLSAAAAACTAAYPGGHVR